MQLREMIWVVPLELVVVVEEVEVEKHPPHLLHEQFNDLLYDHKS